MSTMKNLFRIAACAVMVLMLAVSANATYIGISWVVPGTDAPWLGGTLAPDPIVFPTTGLDARFTSNTVNFMNGPGSGTLLNFITSDPGATVGTCTTATVGAVTY